MGSDEQEVCFKCGKPAGDGVALDAYGVSGKSACLPCVGELARFWMGHTKYEGLRCVRDEDYPFANTSVSDYKVTVSHPAAASWGASEAARQLMEAMIRQDTQRRLGR